VKTDRGQAMAHRSKRMPGGWWTGSEGEANTGEGSSGVRLQKGGKQMGRSRELRGKWEAQNGSEASHTWRA
jgi:hypothetical protein